MIRPEQFSRQSKMNHIGRMADYARREVIAIAILFCVGSTSAEAQQASKPEAGRPNIIILADDMGYGDFGLQSDGKVGTAQIDRLASDGVRITNFFASQTVCAPSRAGLLTGMYQHRFGFEHNAGRNAPADFGIPLQQKTIAERLKQQVYATGMFGKWHIGTSPKQTPTALGFGSDLTVTALTAAGAPIEPVLDGVDLRPFLTGENSGDAHEQLFWRFYSQGAMREGNWKLVTVHNASYLFNLQNDFGERVNLAEQYLKEQK